MKLLQMQSVMMVKLHWMGMTVGDEKFLWLEACLVLFAVCHLEEKDMLMKPEEDQVLGQVQQLDSEQQF